MNQNPASSSEDEPIVQTVSEPLQQILKRASAPPPGLLPPKNSQTAAQNQSNKTLPFRPTNRQPLAKLTILDDGRRDEGETIRIRDSKVVIGRDRGNITLPFDSDISGQHAELRCQKQKGKYRWYLIDLASTNGTFLRAYRAVLSRETELMMGSRRYLFQLPKDHNSLEGDDTQAFQTQTYQAPPRTMLEQFIPRLTETGVETGKPRSFPVTGKEMIFGGDPTNPIAVEGDPFLSPKHARFYQDERERWMVDDQKSLNGVWIRVKRMALDQQAEFQLGHQRFLFQPNLS